MGEFSVTIRRLMTRKQWTISALLILCAVGLSVLIGFTVLSPTRVDQAPQKLVLKKILKNTSSDFSQNIKNSPVKTHWFVAILGLGNRLQSINGFLNYRFCTNFSSVQNKIVWPLSSDLNASFSELFSAPKLDFFQLPNLDDLSDYIIVVQNSFLVKDEFLMSLFNDKVDLKKIHRFNDFTWLSSKVFLQKTSSVQDVIIVSAWGFSLQQSAILGCNVTKLKRAKNFVFQTLKPSKAVKNIMHPVLKDMINVKGKLIGIHFRGGDFRTFHNYKTKTATLINVKDYITKTMKVANIDAIFLATNEKNTSTKLKDFVIRLNSTFLNVKQKRSEKGVNKRDSLIGMQIAAADLFLLANCDEVFSNTRLSSYSRMIPKISNHPLTLSYIPPS